MLKAYGMLWPHVGCIRAAHRRRFHLIWTGRPQHTMLAVTDTSQPWPRQKLCGRVLWRQLTWLCARTITKCIPKLNAQENNFCSFGVWSTPKELMSLGSTGVFVCYPFETTKSCELAYFRWRSCYDRDPSIHPLIHDGPRPKMCQFTVTRIARTSDWFTEFGHSSLPQLYY